jgi:hypothetical protein
MKKTASSNQASTKDTSSQLQSKEKAVSHEMISSIDNDQQIDPTQGEQTQKPIGLSMQKGLMPQKNSRLRADVQKTKSTASSDSGGTSQEPNVAKRLEPVKDEIGSAHVGHKIGDKSTNLEDNEVSASPSATNSLNGNLDRKHKNRFNCNLKQAEASIKKYVGGLGGDCKNNFLDESQSIINCPYLYVYFKPSELSCSLNLRTNEKLKVKQVEIIYRAGNRKTVASMEALNEVLNYLSK